MLYRRHKFLHYQHSYSQNSINLFFCFWFLEMNWYHKTPSVFFSMVKKKFTPIVRIWIFSFGSYKETQVPCQLERQNFYGAGALEYSKFQVKFFFWKLAHHYYQICHENHWIDNQIVWNYFPFWKKLQILEMFQTNFSFNMHISPIWLQGWRESLVFFFFRVALKVIFIDGLIHFYRVL